MTANATYTTSAGRASSEPNYARACLRARERVEMLAAGEDIIGRAVCASISVFQKKRGRGKKEGRRNRKVGR